MWKITHRFFDLKGRAYSEPEELAPQPSKKKVVALVVGHAKFAPEFTIWRVTPPVGKKHFRMPGFGADHDYGTPHRDPATIIYRKG